MLSIAMDYYNFTWILMAASIIGTIFLVYVKMIPGMLINLVASVLWCLYYYHIRQIPATILLGMFSFIYAFGSFKHIRLAIEKNKQPIVPDEDIFQL